MEETEVSSISDEIRTWCGGVGTVKDLRALADRIDAEMVELPKDADGVPIHVGDTVWGCISGMQMAVRQLRLTDRWTISTNAGLTPKASAVTHARPNNSF